LAQSPANSNSDNYRNSVSGGNVGDTEIKTGNSNSSGSITNLGNTNISAALVTDTPSITIANTGNGADSNNVGSAVVKDSSNTNQQNNASLNNNLSVSSNRNRGCQCCWDNYKCCEHKFRGSYAFRI
jgi:hypothetical protein